jgi:hypothetical protein
MCLNSIASNIATYKKSENITIHSKFFWLAVRLVGVA